MHRHAAAIALTLALLAVAAFAAACDDDDGDEPGPTVTSNAATATEPPAATATSELDPSEPFEGGRDPVEGTLSDGSSDELVATLVDVRAAEQDGYDRIVFEFSGAPPGYRVEYVDEPVGCGSGEVVDVEGVAFLEVRFTVAQAHDDAGMLTIDATVLTPGLPAILEAVQTCDFEGYVTWDIGLPEELDFRATPVSGPPQLAVDIAYP